MVDVSDVDPIFKELNLLKVQNSYRDGKVFIKNTIKNQKLVKLVLSNTFIKLNIELKYMWFEYVV